MQKSKNTPPEFKCIGGTGGVACCTVLDVCCVDIVVVVVVVVVITTLSGSHMQVFSSNHWLSHL